MISSFFRTIFYKPLYNGLIFILAYVPNADAGVAIIVFTLIVKSLLFPLSHHSLKTQKQMKKLEPDLRAIKEKHKEDKQEQAKATMALYAEHKLNPFSGFVVILLQIPIIIALYQIFLSGGLPVINTDLLYSFVKAVPDVNMEFLGLIDISKKSLLLALGAGITQFFQAKLSLPVPSPKPKDDANTKPSFSDELMKGMSLQMTYFLPVFVFFISWSVSGAVALYWITNNLFTIGQELYARRSIHKMQAVNSK